MESVTISTRVAGEVVTLSRNAPLNWAVVVPVWRSTVPSLNRSQSKATTMIPWGWQGELEPDASRVSDAGKVTSYGPPASATGGLPHPGSATTTSTATVTELFVWLKSFLSAVTVAMLVMLADSVFGFSTTVTSAVPAGAKVPIVHFTTPDLLATASNRWGGRDQANAGRNRIMDRNVVGGLGHVVCDRQGVAELIALPDLDLLRVGTDRHVDRWAQRRRQRVEKCDAERTVQVRRVERAAWILCERGRQDADGRVSVPSVVDIRLLEYIDVVETVPGGNQIALGIEDQATEPGLVTTRLPYGASGLWDVDDVLGGGPVGRDADDLSAEV